MKIFLQNRLSCRVGGIGNNGQAASCHGPGHHRVFHFITKARHQGTEESDGRNQIERFLLDPVLQDCKNISGLNVIIAVEAAREACAVISWGAAKAPVMFIRVITKREKKKIKDDLYLFDIFTFRVIIFFQRRT